MNPRISSLITKPTSIKPEDLKILEKEIHNYPFMQSLRALHLKALYIYQPEKYKEFLSKTAIYTTDKKILHNLIFGDVTPHEITSAPKIQSLKIKENPQQNQEIDSAFEQKQFEAMQEEVFLSKEVGILEEESLICVEKEEKTGDFDGFQQVNEVENEIISEKIEETEDLKIEKETVENEVKETEKENEVLEMKMETEEAKNEMVLEEKLDENWTPISTEYSSSKNFRNKTQIRNFTEKTKQEKQANLQQPAEKPMQEEGVIVQQSEVDAPKMLIESEKSDEKINLNASNSLKNFLNINPSLETNQEEKIEKVEPNVENKHSETLNSPSNVPSFINNWKHWLMLNQNQNSEALLVKKADVINQFIENNPKINKLKEEAEISAQFVKDRGDDISHLMTDTLAGMYLQQNYYLKAITAYEILMKKFPHKKKFYQEKIKEVKEARSAKN